MHPCSIRPHLPYQTAHHRWYRQDCADTPSVFVSSSPWVSLSRHPLHSLSLLLFSIYMYIYIFLLHRIPPLQCQTVSPWLEGLWWSCHLKSGNFIGLLATLSLLITPTTATDLLPLMGSLSDIYLDLWSLLHIVKKKKRKKKKANDCEWHFTTLEEAKSSFWWIASEITSHVSLI